MEDNNEEIGWLMNDVSFTMVLLVLFFAIMFALMVGESARTKGLASEADIQKNKPTELSSLSFFGEVGFPEGTAEKGFPVKDTFNQDLILSENETSRDGLEGNRVWEFEDISPMKDKKIIKIRLGTDQKLRYEGSEVPLREMRKIIDTLAEDLHVFVELEIDPSVPFAVYDAVRNELWNKTDAIHWRFILK